MPSVNLKGMSFEKGLRIFRKKCQRAEIKERCREKEYYEKPNAKKKSNEQLQEAFTRVRQTKDRTTRI